MAAYQAGHEAAFSQLFDRYADRVYGFLARRLGDGLLAEDLHQEVFLRMHRGRRTYDATRPFRPWLYGIAHNVLTDALRSRGRSPEVPSADPPPGPAEGESPEVLAAVHERAQAVERALTTLPSDEATVLLLVWNAGLSYLEAGEVLGRSAPATKQLAYRALKRLRAVLGAEEERGAVP